MPAGQRFFEECVMRKIIVGVFLVAGLVLASGQQQQNAQQTQSGVKKAEVDSGSPGSTSGNRDPAVPSPDKYPFAEALKRLQADGPAQPSTGSAQSSRVPPLTVLPTPAVGPRSKQVPKDYLVKRDVPLNETGQDAVAVSRQWQYGENIPAPGKDGRVLYVYGAGLPIVVCSPLHVCVLELQTGEKLVGEPQIGDNVRWQISPATAGAGEGAMPLIIIKPTQAGLDTTMVIPTDRRAYYIRLQSKPEEFLARVAFAYPDNQSQEWKRYAEEQKQDAARQKREKTTEKILPDTVDALYWDYQIKGGDPTIRPVRVLDDGIKTYIQMPLATQRTEAPVLVVQGPDGSEMVNYRVKDDPQNKETLTYIVDRLFNRAALVVGAGKHARKVEITRRTPIGQQQSEKKSANEGNGGGL
jgi:type IV secretion system protein VirB9